jgi:tetratricopeptide (TPR) repeat protein
VTGSSPLVGRARDLAALEAAWLQARGGVAVTVLVTGEAGIGKTRLASEIGRRVHKDGGRVLRGDCLPLLDGALPFAALAQALRPLADSLPEGLPAHLGVLFDGGRPAPVPGLAGRGMLFDAVRASMVAVAPALLVIEDVQWADPSTAQVLSFLARALPSTDHAAVMVLLTCRVEPGAVPPPLVSDLRRLPGEVLIELGRLTNSDTKILFDALVDEPASGEWVAEVAERADGIPLFIEELASAGEAAPVPAAARDLLLRRIAQLGPDGLHLTRCAAVIGRQSTHALLSSLTGLDEAAVRGAVRDALQGGVFVREGPDGYVFRHALLRELAYDDLLGQERRELHARAAGALEACGASPGEIVHHWVRCGDDRQAWAWSLRAADAAETMHALNEAATHAERAVQLWLGDVDARFLVRLAAWHELLGNHERAAGLLEQAANSGVDPATQALLHARRGLSLCMLGEQDAGVAATSQSMQRLPELPPRMRAEVLAHHASCVLLGDYDIDEAGALCIEAVRLIEANGLDELLPRALMNLGVQQLAAGERAAATATLRRALACAEGAGLGHDVAFAAICLSECLIQSGELVAAVDCAEAAVATAERLGFGELWLNGMLLTNACEACSSWANGSAVAISPSRLLPTPGRRPA